MKRGKKGNKVTTNQEEKQKMETLQNNTDTATSYSAHKECSVQTIDIRKINLIFDLKEAAKFQISPSTPYKLKEGSSTRGLENLKIEGQILELQTPTKRKRGRPCSNQKVTKVESTKKELPVLTPEIKKKRGRPISSQKKQEIEVEKQISVKNTPKNRKGKQRTGNKSSESRRRGRPAKSSKTQISPNQNISKSRKESKMSVEPKSDQESGKGKRVVISEEESGSNLKGLVGTPTKKSEQGLQIRKGLDLDKLKAVITEGNERKTRKKVKKEKEPCSPKTTALTKEKQNIQGKVTRKVSPKSNQEILDRKNGKIAKYSKENLLNMNKDQLFRICSENGLKKQGGKEDMVSRILKAFPSDENNQPQNLYNINVAQ